MVLNPNESGPSESTERLRLTPYAHELDAFVQAQNWEPLNPSISEQEFRVTLLRRARAIIDQLHILSRRALETIPRRLEQPPYDPTDANIRKVGRYILTAFLGWKVAQLLSEREIEIDFSGSFEYSDDVFDRFYFTLMKIVTDMIRNVFEGNESPLFSFNHAFSYVSHTVDNHHPMLQLNSLQIIVNGSNTQLGLMSNLAKAIPYIVARDLPDLVQTPENLAQAFRSAQSSVTLLALSATVRQLRFDESRAVNLLRTPFNQRAPNPFLMYFYAVRNPNSATATDRPILIKRRPTLDQAMQATPSARARLGCPMHIPPPPRRKRSSDSPSPDPSGEPSFRPPGVSSLIRTYFDKYASLLPKAYALYLENQPPNHAPEST